MGGTYRAGQRRNLRAAGHLRVHSYGCCTTRQPKVIARNGKTKKKKNTQCTGSSAGEVLYIDLEAYKK